MKLFFYFMCLTLHGYINVSKGENSNEISQGNIIINQIVENFSEEMKEKHGFSLFGRGGGADNGTWLILLAYEFNHAPIDQNYARHLIVDCTEELLSKINARKDLVPYLKNYPFTSKNINLKIFCCDEQGQDTVDPFITIVSCLQGDIVYKTNYPNTVNGYKSRIEEPYEEALAILKKENKKLNE